MDRWSMLLLVGVVGLLLGALLGSAITNSVAQRRARKQELKPPAADASSDGRTPVQPDWTVAVTGSLQASVAPSPPAQQAAQPLVAQPPAAAFEPGAEWTAPPTYSTQSAYQPQPPVAPQPVEPVQPAWPAAGLPDVPSPPTMEQRTIAEQQPAIEPMAPEPQPRMDFGLQPQAQPQWTESAAGYGVQSTPPPEPVFRFEPAPAAPGVPEKPVVPVLPEEAPEEPLAFDLEPDVNDQSFDWPTIEGLTQAAPVPPWEQPVPQQNVAPLEQPVQPPIAPEPVVPSEPPAVASESRWQTQQGWETQPAPEPQFPQDLSLEADLRQGIERPETEAKPMVDFGLQAAPWPEPPRQPEAPVVQDASPASQPAPAPETAPPAAFEPVSQSEPVSQFGLMNQFEPVSQFEPVPETIFVPEPIFEEIPETGPAFQSPQETPGAVHAEAKAPNEPQRMPQSIAEALEALRFEPKPLPEEVEEDVTEVKAAAAEPLAYDVQSGQTVDAGFDQANSDIVVVPGLLDEPLPGAGWESMAQPVDEDAVDQVFEAQLPKIAPQEEPAFAAPAIPASPPAASPVPPLSAEDLKARIEETRRRIRQELEQPFFSGFETEPESSKPEATQAAQATPGPVPSPPAPAPARPEQPEYPAAPDRGFTEFGLPQDDAPVVELLPESSIVPGEPDLWFGSPRPEDPTPEAHVGETEPNAEWQFDPPAASGPLTAEAIFAEAASSDLSLTQSWEIPEWKSIDDPASGGGSSDAWFPVEEPQSPASSIHAPMDAAQPVAAEPMAAPAPSPQPMAPAAVATPLVQPVDLDLDFDSASIDAIPAGVSADPDPADDSPLGAIKSKIEQTRGKLKAKAFDAMMNGESSLLADNSSDGMRSSGGRPMLDDDLDKTIETGLSEAD